MLWVLLFVALILCAPGHVRAEETIADVEASEADNHGRIVFTFRDRSLLPEFSTRIANGVLQIDFVEPVRASIDHVALSMKKYISVALEDPAGFGVRFGLKAKFRVNTIEAGEKLFVDILPINWEGELPSLPDDVIKELAQRAEAALKRVRDLEERRFGKTKKPKVTLRVGRHPTFSRLSFFWNVPFDTNFQREGDIVRLVFSRDSDLNLYDVLADKPPGLLDFDTLEEGDKLKIVLLVDKKVDVRAFREEDAYVVDIAPRDQRLMDVVNTQVRAALSEPGAGNRRDVVTAPAAPEETDAPEPAQDSAGGQRVVRTATPQSEDTEVRVPPLNVPVGDMVVNANESAEQVVEQMTRDPAPRSTPPQETAPQDLSPVDQASRDNGTGKPIPPVGRINTSIAPIDQKTDPLAAAIPRSVAIGNDGQVLDPENIPVSAESSLEGNSDEDSQIAPNLVDAEASRIGNMVRVVFPFKEETPAAVFIRHQSLWLIFDTGNDIGLESLRSALKPLTRRIEAGKLEDARTVRIDLKGHVLATVGADGNSWIVNIGDMILEPSKPVSFKRSVRADGGMVLSTKFPQVGRIRKLRDPKIGDDIFVVTARGPAMGVIKPQRFVEMDALTSAHGIALVSRSDDLMVSLKEDNLVVEQPRGLSLSSQNLTRGITLLPLKSGVSRPGFVDFREMYEPNPIRFQFRKKQLQNALARVEKGSKSAEWLALARFYLANRFAHEALGILTLVGQEDPAIANDSAYLLMMGAAEVLAGRPKAAERYILQNKLDDSPDADIWKVIHHASVRNWTEARKPVQRARRAVGNYPPDLQALFNLSAAEASVALNDFGEATAVLAEIDPALIEPVFSARYDIMRARLADVSDRPEDAIQLLERVIEFGKRPNVAEAKYRLLKIQHRDNLRPAEEIIDDLRGLAVIWRGDELELKLARFLAQLLVEKGDYREAFTAARAALFVDGDADTTKLVQDEMNGVFSALFIDGKADELEPIEALGLFYDFREMTPIGQRGDAIVRNLAQRLVDVDLLDQASELLQHQVDNRLKGAARAQISADLALIYLLDRKPDKALRTLRRSRQAKLPESMERQRRLVESRALIEAGRYQTALDLLETLRGPEVDRMTADAFWAAKRWEEAGEQYESLVAGRWSLKAPLSDNDRLDVLKAAIGFSISGNQLALDRLRAKFSGKMNNTEHSSAFDVVTSSINASGTDFSVVAAQIASIDTLEMFLKEYRARYSSTEVPDAGANGV